MVGVRKKAPISRVARQGAKRRAPAVEDEAGGSRARDSSKSAKRSATKPKPSPSAAAGATVISEDPVILLFPSFVSESECATLLAMSQATENYELCARSAAERRLVADIEDRIGGITSCPPHAEEPPLLPLHQPPTERAAGSKRGGVERFPSGFHVDTNGGMTRRFASALIYLTTPTSGGQTVFPLAVDAVAAERRGGGVKHKEDAAALSASHTLLRSGVYHTGNSRKPLARTLEAFAQPTPLTSTPPTEAGHAANGRGVSVRAKAGNLLVFWTRRPDGIDPRSWHAGEVVAPESREGKWMVRKFKEVPADTFDDAGARRRFLEASMANVSARGTGATR